MILMVTTKESSYKWGRGGFSLPWRPKAPLPDALICSSIRKQDSSVLRRFFPTVLNLAPLQMQNSSASGLRHCICGRGSSIRNGYPEKIYSHLKTLFPDQVRNDKRERTPKYSLPLREGTQRRGQEKTRS